MPFTVILDGFAVREANSCCGNAANGWSGGLPICIKRPDARVYVRGHTNNLERTLLHTPALNLGLLEPKAKSRKPFFTMSSAAARCL
jgi:hypothetical protein